VSSWLYEALGEAYAITGERARGAKALLQAETLFDTVTTVPAWLGFFDSAAHLTRLKGRCLTRLGDGRHATAALSQALTMLPAHYVREQSGTLIDLAAAYLLPGVLDPAAAAHAASQAHDLAVLTKSARNLKRVRTLMPTFHRYRTIPEVRTLITAVG
jgi:tetratricopeptide (TPR) repeat protein